jgi:hypothetical protein
MAESTTVAVDVRRDGPEVSRGPGSGWKMWEAGGLYTCDESFYRWRRLEEKLTHITHNCGESYAHGTQACVRDESWRNRVRAAISTIMDGTSSRKTGW